MNYSPLRRAILAATPVVAGAAMLSGLAGCNGHPEPEAPVATASHPTAASVARIPASSPQPRAATPDAKSFTTTGPLVAEQQADVAVERSGRVTNIAVQIGDRVQRGQLLASLDDRALRSACEAQKARIAATQADIRDWEAEEASVKNDLRRADKLHEAKISSDEEWEHAKYKVDETVAKVARYRSEEAAAKADLDSATIQLDQSKILAPFRGVVGRSSVRPEQEVKQGDVLFWVTAEAPLRVLFTVPESLMSSFAIGKPLILTTADYAGLEQHGRILRVSPVVDPASGSVQVIGEVLRPSPMLKPGMTMQVRLAP